MKVKLSNILVPRCPPFLWDILIYGFGLLYIFSNIKHLLTLVYTLFATCNLSNLFFNYCTVSIELTTSLPVYNSENFKLQNIYIFDKKYYLKSAIPVTSGFPKQNDEPNCLLIDKNNTSLNVNVYIGNNLMVEQILYFIYLFGLTKKNYTREHKNNFIDNEYFCS